MAPTRAPQALVGGKTSYSDLAMPACSTTLPQRARRLRGVSHFLAIGDATPLGARAAAFFRTRACLLRS